MTEHSSFLTVDSNIVIASMMMSEPASQKCDSIIEKATKYFVLAEPSIIYQEVCGTLSRKANLGIAKNAIEQLDSLIMTKYLVNCDRKTCISASGLCAQHRIYAIDALYLHAALTYNSILVSLDKEFIKGLNSKELPIEAYTVVDFPY